jgi:hypothetical protein
MIEQPRRWHITVLPGAQSPVGYSHSVDTVRSCLVRHGFVFQPSARRHTGDRHSTVFTVSHHSEHAMLLWSLAYAAHWPNAVVEITEHEN